MLKQLFKPIDIAPLIFFRTVVGGLITIEILGEVLTNYSADYFHPDFHFSYLFFQWLKPWPPFWMHIHFWLNVLMGLFVTIGLFYRFSAIILFLGTTSAFFMEKSVYINHTYLYCLTVFLMIFLPANRAWSVDVKRKPEIQQSTVPAWTVYILVFQISVVYFFAGLAKVNPDWLAGIPMNIWLPAKQHYYIIGPLLKQSWLPYLISWGGVIFDLTIVPFMLWRKTRKIAFIVAVCFHLINVSIFGIGTFPWYSIAMTALFFPPETFRKLPILRKKLPPVVDISYSKTYRTTYQQTVIAFLGLYALIQILVPLRQYFYPGENPSWTENGHNFSWHMMLRSKSGSVFYKVKDPASQQEWTEYPLTYLTPHQYHNMVGKPDMIIEFAHFLAAKYEEKGYPNVEVRAFCLLSFNGRPERPFVDTTVNLAAEPRHIWHYEWILPFEKEVK